MQFVQAGGGHGEDQDDQRGGIFDDIETAEKKISSRCSNVFNIVEISIEYLSV